MTTAVQIIETRSQILLDSANGLKLTNVAEATAAKDFLNEVKFLLKEIDETFDPIIESAHKSHKTAIEQKKKHAGPLLAVKAAIDDKLRGFLQAQEQARLAVIAAEEEKARRIEEKARAIAAEELRAAGYKKEAKELVAQPIFVAVDVPAVAKIEGLSSRNNWEFEITDPAKLPREYLEPDLVKIGKVVKAMKEMTAIPGVRAFARKLVNTR